MEDLHGEYTVLMFENDRFEEYADIFKDDHIVLINGKVRVNQDEIFVMAEQIECHREINNESSVIY